MGQHCTVLFAAELLLIEQSPRVVAQLGASFLSYDTKETASRAYTWHSSLLTMLPWSFHKTFSAERDY